MMNNWAELLFKAIVPLCFVAIWALTALFNRESKGFPAPPRPPGPSPSGGPRPGDPTLRWSTPAGSQASGVRRVPIGDDDILIIQSDPSRAARPAAARPAQGMGVRRAVKVRQGASPARKVEPVVARQKLSGVSQNVNQSLARPIELTPLTTIAPMSTTSGSDLANAPSSPSKTSEVLTVSTLIPLMHDPRRLREAFIVNELFRPPVALRGRRGHHA
jgi:hypothetical protein